MVTQRCVVDNRVFLLGLDKLYRNAVSNQIALRLTSRLREQSWNANVETLAGAISGTLSDWNDKGVAPPLPMHGDQLDAITEIIHEKWF